MDVPKRTDINGSKESRDDSYRGSITRLSGRALPWYADPIKAIQFLEKWKSRSPRLFATLRKKIAERPRGETCKKKLLKKLDHIKGGGDEDWLIGLLKEAIEESTTRDMLSLQKKDRVSFNHAAANNLDLAANDIRQLAKLDEGAALMATLVVGKDAGRHAQARAEWELSLADKLTEYACVFNSQLKAAKSISQRWLGVSGSASRHGNLEWIVLLKNRFGFSVGELALLIEAAQCAWKGPQVCIDPYTLSRAINRFIKRNPDFL